MFSEPIVMKNEVHNYNPRNPTYVPCSGFRGVELEEIENVEFTYLG
jgi:translation elongation factor EF-1alpha